MEQSMLVLNVDEVVALEQRIAAEGTSLFELMQRAGHSVSEFIREQVAPREAPRMAPDETGETSESVVILCGSGNNGGDGWVVADDLIAMGYPVTLVTAHPAESLTTEPARSAAQRTLERLASRADSQLLICVAPDENQLIDLFRSAACVVDAILGTGFNGSAVKEPYATWIRTLNATKVRRDRDASGSLSPARLSVVAVDVPSGLSAQTGVAAEPTVLADATITMLVYKPGLLVATAQEYCGEIHLARIHDINSL